jgi:hypothetical protein
VRAFSPCTPLRIAREPEFLTGFAIAGAKSHYCWRDLRHD